MAAVIALALFPLLLQCVLLVTWRHGNSPLSALLNPHSRCKFEDRDEVTTLIPLLEVRQKDCSS